MKAEPVAGKCVPLEEIYEWVEKAPAEELEARRAHIDSCPQCQESLDLARSLARLAEEIRALPQTISTHADWSSLAREVSRAAPGSERPSNRIPPATPVLPRIHIVRHIARGGCAEVWLARDEAGYVVVKSVQPDVDRHELEALRHYKQLADDPRLGLFPIHYIGRCESSGRLCYTMPTADPLHGRTIDPDDYLPATLQSVAETTKGMAVEDALSVAEDVLATLEALHGLGLVHRDVKPSNILRYHGRWCLADTGLLTREGSQGNHPRVGTPRYLSPENRNDHRSADLYALGKTLYVALRGDLAGFPAPSPEHLRAGKDAAAYRALYRCIERACEPDPSQRTGSAARMRTDLRPSRFPVRAVAVALLGALLIATPLAVFAMLREKSAAWASASGTPQAGHLELRFQRPGAQESQTLRPGSPLRAGVEMQPVASEVSRAHVALVLAHYIGGRRSVYPYTPSAPDAHGAVAFGPRQLPDGRAASFLLLEPTPLLAILVGSDDPIDSADLERRVESVLDASGSWPPTPPPPPLPRSSLGGDAVSLRFHGAEAFPMGVAEKLRGGPKAQEGSALAPARLQALLAALSAELEAFDGIATEVLD